MKTYISINGHTIRSNAVHGKKDAPIRVAKSPNDSKPVYASAVKWNGPAQIVYNPYKKIMRCGARLVLIVEGEVEIVK